MIVYLDASALARRYVAEAGSDDVAARAAAVAWEHGLRGYDAGHLATALFWQDMLGERVTVATFDRFLWGAACRSEPRAWPEDLAYALVRHCYGAWWRAASLTAAARWLLGRRGSSAERTVGSARAPVWRIVTSSHVRAITP